MNCLLIIKVSLVRPVARGGQGGQLTPPLENQMSTFWNLAREIIKANNYKWLTIYLHQLLCTKPPTKWLQNLLSKGGSGGANLCLRRVAVTRVPHTPSADRILVESYPRRFFLTPKSYPILAGVYHLIPTDCQVVPTSI